MVTVLDITARTLYPIRIVEVALCQNEPRSTDVLYRYQLYLL